MRTLTKKKKKNGKDTGKKEFFLFSSYRKADQELEAIEKQINERKENARRLIGTQDDAICQICQKTKFADGIGHKCFYCQLRSCARCGGRTTSKNKVWFLKNILDNFQ